MSTPTPEKPARKFPPPCWTKEEALALIEAYRDRWYALRRGYLRTADWESVAEAIGHRFPCASPAKTSAQCRHKMEKLRQRYRVEKQRSLSLPGKFFSSWFFFDNMDSMENGPGSELNPENRIGSVAGIRIRSISGKDLVESMLGAKKFKVDGKSNSNPNPDLGPDGVGFRARNRDNIDGNSGPIFGSKVLNGRSPYFDDESEEDCEDNTELGGGCRAKAPVDGKFVKLGKIRGSFEPDSNHNEDDDGIDAEDDEGGSYGKNPVAQVFVPPGFKANKFGYNNGGCCVTVPDGRYSVPTGVRVKGSGKAGGISYANIEPRFLNGSSSALGLGLMKKDDDRGVKRERDLIAEIVLAIRMLGDAFVQTEQMKMDMVREIEKMRMDMEVKRNEVIIESQRQIVDAFMAVLLENKKRKASSIDKLES